MEFSVTPLSPACGAAVTGIDLRDQIDRATVDRLLDAWHEHIVLVFPGQDLTEDEQVRFACNFGELGPRQRKANDRPEGRGAEYIMLVTNIRKDGVPIGSLPDGEMFFHHDKCYTEVPDRATFLYALEVTNEGGHTLFANMYKAYEILRPELKERLAGRRALQIYQYLPTQRVDLNESLDKYDHYIQPVVVVHPATGRKALYTNQLMTARIEGLPEEESRAILDELWRVNEDSGVVYEHIWQPGDLVMWDNRCSTHARTDFPADQTRLLRRCTVKGDRMIPAD